MYNTTWLCKKTVKGWNNRYTFYEGQTYHLPYAWPVHAGAYIGYGISVENFVNAAADSDNKDEVWEIDLGGSVRDEYISEIYGVNTFYGNYADGSITDGYVEIKLIDYNVQTGNTYYTQTTNWLKAQTPDIIGLQ